MLAEFNPVTAIAVKDLAQARAFYEGTLGFSAGTERADGVMYTAGVGRFLVYPSAYAGTNKATAISFEVPRDAFDAEVAALRATGVTFQTFEMENLVWDDGVAAIGADTKAVWFADPDGNILNVSTPLEAMSA